MSRENQKLIVGPIEGYKIFNKDLTCRDFQFEIGKRNKLDNDNELEECKNWFHFCKYPSGVWNYYRKGRIFKIRAYEVLETQQTPGANYKMICREIELVEEIEITDISNTGYCNVGHYNSGNCNSGDFNSGNYNKGEDNIGDFNSGYNNIENHNTGHGNIGNYHSGSLNRKEAPVYIFDKKVEIPRNEINWNLVNELAFLLTQNDPIDTDRFLSLPNATAEEIRELHEAHKKERIKSNK